MTTTPVTVRFEVELPGTPEQVWAALATGDGLSAWFLPTTVEDGTVVTQMGESSRTATVTAFEPPSRLVHEETGWAALAGRPDAPVGPLRSEFLVEARSGGTCVVTVVSSAYGTGADWEAEFMTEMRDGWVPFFENLRLYLSRFPGRTASFTELDRRFDVDAFAVWDAVRAAAGEGDTVEVAGLQGAVQFAEVGAVFARLDGPAPGYLSLHAYHAGPGAGSAFLRVWLFGPDAAAVTQRERPAWQAWLDGLSAQQAVPA